MARKWRNNGKCEKRYSPNLSRRRDVSFNLCVILALKELEGRMRMRLGD